MDHLSALVPAFIILGTTALLGLGMVLYPGGAVDLANGLADGLHRFRSQLERPRAYLAPEPLADSPAVRTAIRLVGATLVVAALLLLIELA